MTEPPIITVRPTHRFGQPAINGISVDAIAEAAYTESVDDAADQYSLTGQEVILACWHEATYGSDKKLRHRWRVWADENALLFHHGDYASIPDPPGRDGVAP